MCDVLPIGLEVVPFFLCFRALPSMQHTVSVCFADAMAQNFDAP